MPCPHVSRYFWTLGNFFFLDTASVHIHLANSAVNLDVKKIILRQIWIVNQYGGAMCGSSFSRVNLDIIRCVWTSEFDLNMLHLDREILNPDTCGQGLNLDFEIRGPQHSAMSMCTGHPVFHYSVFVMGLNFITG